MLTNIGCYLKPLLCKYALVIFVQCPLIKARFEALTAVTPLTDDRGCRTWFFQQIIWTSEKSQEVLESLWHLPYFQVLMKELLRQKGTQRPFHRTINTVCQAGDLWGGNTHTHTHTHALFEAPWKMKSYLIKVIMWEDGLEDSSLDFCEGKNAPIYNWNSARRLKRVVYLLLYLPFSKGNTSWVGWNTWSFGY